MTEPARFGKYSKTIRELQESVTYLGEALVRAVADERERCAKIAETCDVEGNHWRHDIAAAIRAVNQ